MSSAGVLSVIFSTGVMRDLPSPRVSSFLSRQPNRFFMLRPPCLQDCCKSPFALSPLRVAQHRLRAPARLSTAAFPVSLRSRSFLSWAPSLL